MAIVKVKAICNFADSKSSNGIRFLGEVFETSQERVEFLNGLRDFPLVEVIEEVLEEKPARKRKKRVSESDSDNVSEEKIDPTSVEIATGEV
ncbi:TPA: hypothetical protein U1343_000704 [Streptococcus suis]|nr:hypothetical protein [Streptococcus suis]HEM5234850.1 hypothetical protein [Streptococcus suis]HEM5241870.1 hypothetical protein [Streptococcus suis]